MVIVQILPALVNGGVERGTIEVANYLAALGHTSIVISAGGSMQGMLSPSVQHITLDVGKKSLLSLLIIKDLKSIFIDKKVDIVHARSRLPAWLSYRAITKIKSDKPGFVTTIHGLYSVKRYSSIMARGDRVIAVSNTAASYVKENYASYLKTPISIIYRGVNPDEFKYGYEADILWLQNWYKKYPNLVGHKTVLLPGRLTTLKGVKELLLWLKSSDNDAKLLLTADKNSDSYAAKLDRFFKANGIENRVVWIGLQQSMADLYAVVDVVVSTSLRPESFGRTVVEALAIGTPVVGYNHGGVGEILKEIFPQGAVKLGNAQQLSDQINWVLKNKPTVENKQPFMLNTMLSKTMQVYQEVFDD